MLVGVLFWHTSELLCFRSPASVRLPAVSRYVAPVPINSVLYGFAVALCLFPHSGAAYKHHHVPRTAFYNIVPRANRPVRAAETDEKKL